MAATPDRKHCRRLVGRVLRDLLADLVSCDSEHPSVGCRRLADLLVRVDPEARALAELAIWHRVPGYAWRFLQQYGLGDTAGGAWCRAAARDAVARHLRATTDAAAVAKALSQAGIVGGVVKGPILTATLYPRPELRWYADLDVLVAPKYFAAALASLEGAGFRLYDVGWRLLHAAQAGEIHLIAPAGSVVDLHWSLIGNPRLREHMRLSVEDLLQPGRDVNVGGTAVRTLSRIDTLVHVAVHAAGSGADRLGWLVDVVQAARGIEARNAADRAREWGLPAAFGTAFCRAARCLRQPMPRELTNGLMGYPWRMATAVIDYISPVWHLSEQGSLPRLAARAASTTGVASFARLARRSTAFLREELRVGDAAPQRFEPVDMSSTEPDNRRARDEYLRYVESVGF